MMTNLLEGLLHGKDRQHDAFELPRGFSPQTIGKQNGVGQELLPPAGGLYANAPKSFWPPAPIETSSEIEPEVVPEVEHEVQPEVTQLTTTQTPQNENKPKKHTKKKHTTHHNKSWWDTIKKVGLTAGGCLTEATIDYYMFNLARQKDQQTGDGSGKKWQDIWHGVQAGALIPGITGLLTRFGGAGSGAGFLGAQLCGTNDMLYYALSNVLPGPKGFDHGFPQNDNINWMNWSPAAWLPKLFGGNVHRNEQGEQTITRDAFMKESAIGGLLALGLPILGDRTGIDTSVDGFLGKLLPDFLGFGNLK